MSQSQIRCCLHAFDHIVLTVNDVPATISFYAGVLGMEQSQFEAADGTRRWALRFGNQKINLHLAGQEFDPKASRPTPGSADLCFLTDTPLEAWQAHLGQIDVEIEAGPVPRSGAAGPILSLYIRDPDQNLIEISAPVR